MKRLLTTFALCAVAIAAISCFCSAPALAQQTRRLPGLRYYAAFPAFYRGDYRDALRTFQSEYRTAFRIGDKRFLDSICILTMIGECHYHVGDYQRAMEAYNESLSLYMVQQSENWQSRVQLPAQIQADTSAVQRAQVNWGTPTRTGGVANLPDTISVLRGRLDASRVFQDPAGGAFDPAELRPVDVVEVMRCVALALHRRRIINGPTGKHDRFGARLVSSVRRSGRGDGSFWGSLNGIVYGMALSGIGKYDEAIVSITPSLQLNGRLDHPLTALGLAELGYIAAIKDKPQEAQLFALESTYTGAYFFQPDVMEEGFTTAAISHLIEKQQPLAALEPASLWARRKRADMLQASVLSRLAESLSELGNAVGSTRTLEQAAGLINNRNNLRQTLVTSRIQYTTALNQFLSGDRSGGLTTLAGALEHFRARSLGQYRLNLADALVVNNGVTEKQADQLYSQLLKDPSERQWKLDPMEGIAFLTSPHVKPMERWFEILINRKKFDQAIEVADLIRRHRFYAALPLGGRLLAFRWVMHGDPQILTRTALRQRQTFLTKYSSYRDLLNRATILRDELSKLPLKPDDGSDELRQQTDLIGQLAAVSSRQEAFLASVALRREPTELAFPPTGNTSDVQAVLTPTQIVLVMLETDAGYHIFFMDHQRSRYFGLVSARAVKRGLFKILKGMGVAAATASPTALAEQQWQESLQDFQANLFEDIDPLQLAQTQELVVIPDGLFWYVPFGAFEVPAGEQPIALATAMKVRYCPTLFLAFANPSVEGAIAQTGVVTGPMYTKTDATNANNAYQEIVKELPEAVQFDRVLNNLPSNFYGWLMDQMVVLATTPSRGSWQSIQPFLVDRGDFGTTLGDWLTLPAWAPEHMIMPGLNSIGGTNGRSQADGSELFFTTTALMASGSRSLLVSRWNTGGRLQSELAGHFAKLAPSLNVGDAWQKSVAHVRSLDVDLSLEPRLKEEQNIVGLTGDSPFFWSSQILVSQPDTRRPNELGDGQPLGIADRGDAFEKLGGQTPPPLPTIIDLDTKDLGADKPSVTGQVADQNTQRKKANQDDDDDDDEGAVWKIGGKK